MDGRAASRAPHALATQQACPPASHLYAREAQQALKTLAETSTNTVTARRGRGRVRRKGRNVGSKGGREVGFWIGRGRKSRKQSNLVSSFYIRSPPGKRVRHRAGGKAISKKRGGPGRVAIYKKAKGVVRVLHSARRPPPTSHQSYRRRRRPLSPNRHPPGNHLPVHRVVAQDRRADHRPPLTHAGVERVLRRAVVREAPERVRGVVERAPALPAD